MIEKRLEDLETRYNELSDLLGLPDVARNAELYQKYAIEHASLHDLVEIYREMKSVERELDGNRQILEGKDEELRELAKEEIPALQKTKEDLARKLKVMLLPKDPNDDRSIVVEIRAGAGGDESAIFAAELFRMYSRYAEIKGWKVDVLNINPTGLNGAKEVIAEIVGKGAYSRFKFESGVHRVQRVPETEASGRRHTSTVTVAVMPEAEDVEVDIRMDDIKVDTTARAPRRRNVNKVGRREDDPPPYRHGSHVPGREEPAQEQGKGFQGPEGPHTRRQGPGTAKADSRRQKKPGGHRRQVGEDTDVQLPAEQGHGPQDRAYAPQALRDNGRRAR
jgi:peptide chain release factor 1